MQPLINVGSGDGTLVFILQKSTLLSEQSPRPETLPFNILLAILSLIVFG